MESTPSKLVPPLKLKLPKDSAKSSVTFPISDTPQSSLCKSENISESSSDNLPVFENNVIDAVMEGLIKAGAQLSKLANENADMAREKAILEEQLSQLLRCQIWVADLKNRETQALADLQEERIKQEEEKRKMDEEVAKLKEERDRERLEYAVEINKMNSLLNEEKLKVISTTKANQSLQLALENQIAEVAKMKEAIGDLRNSLKDEKSKRLRDREEFVDERKRNQEERMRDTNEFRDVIVEKNDELSNMRKRWAEETAKLKRKVQNAMENLQADIDREMAEKAIEKEKADEKIREMEEEKIRAKEEYEAGLLKMQTLIDEEKRKAAIIDKSTDELWRQIGAAIAAGSTVNPAVVKGINTGLHQQLISSGSFASFDEDLPGSNRSSDHDIASTEFPTSSTSHRAEKRKRIDESDKDSKRMKSINADT